MDDVNTFWSYIGLFAFYATCVGTLVFILNYNGLIGRNKK